MTAPTAGGGRAGRGARGGGRGTCQPSCRPGVSREPDTRVVVRVGSRRKRRERREWRVGEGDGRRPPPLWLRKWKACATGRRGRARGRTSVVRDEDLADDPRASSGEHIVLVLYLGSSHCGRGKGGSDIEARRGREPSRLVRRPIVARTHRHGGRGGAWTHSCRFARLGSRVYDERVTLERSLRRVAPLAS